MANRMVGSGRRFLYEWTVPRGPASAYALYIRDHYRRLRKHFTPRTNDQRAILNYCYRTWKEEKQEMKDRYAEYAKQDEDRAYRDRIHWLTLVQKGETPYVPLRRHRIRPPGFPRLPRNSFVHFAAEARRSVREKNPTLTACEIMKEVAKIWKRMSPDEREKYRMLSEEERRRYKAQKEKFKNEARALRHLKQTAMARTRSNDIFNQRVGKSSRADPPSEAAKS